ncbi:MAG: hypothetical protein ACKOPQ_02495 [Novosphingobium sp.]
MSAPDDQLQADREQREQARQQVLDRFSALKGALAEKGIGRRIGEKAANSAKAAADDVVEIAAESKGVIAGTAGLLALWFLRRPIASAGRKWWPKVADWLGKEKRW